jgi:hypothetical protein
VIEWWLLLTPVLVLGVVLLLGFAGCSYNPRRAEPRELTLRARVPTALTVTRILFLWTPPGETELQHELINPTPVRTEGADGLYEHTLSPAANGSWEVGCRVEVRVGAANAADADRGTFTLDDSNPDSAAPFQAAGSPAGGNFTVIFTGLVPA